MRLRANTLALTFLLGLAAWPACSDPLLLAETLATLRESKAAKLHDRPLLSGRLLADFYGAGGDRLLWTDRDKVVALRELVDASPAEGFSTEDFHGDRLHAFSEPGALGGLPPHDRVAADILLTDALLRYAHHTRFGKLDPVAMNPRWNDRPAIPEELLIDDMKGALDAPDLKAFLDARFSKPFWYESLKRALAVYRGSTDLDSVPELPRGTRLAKGDRDPWVVVLRERLLALGDQSVGKAMDADVFDETLHAGVASFQKRFGLNPDGAVGPVTLATLNHPVDEEKAEQIRINLERMRWLYNDLPSDYIFVDVAGYMGHVVRDGEVVWSTRVIVGAADAQTPMFRDTMQHVVFNPSWIVPVSIQKTMGRVSGKYLLVDRRTGRKVSGGDARDYKRYRVEQQPGPTNALGRVKFIFPNRHSVYLHDTPSRGLFSRSSRALSHGCVRVQNPLKLAEILLDGAGWERKSIDRVLAGTQTRYVNLETDLPVLLYYLTARADDEGKVTFRPDIYGRDQRVKRAFASPVLSARIAFPEPPAPPAETPEEVPAQPAPNVPSAPVVLPPSQNGVRLTQAGTPEPQP